MLHPPTSTGEGSSPRCLGIKRSRLDLVEAGPELHQPVPARPRLVRVLLQPVPVLLRLALVRSPLVPEAAVRVLHQQDPVARQEDPAEDPAEDPEAPEAAVLPRAVVQAVQAAPALEAADLPRAVLQAVQAAPAPEAADLLRVVVQAAPAPVVSAARLRAEAPAPVREAPMPRRDPVRERARARAPQVPEAVPEALERQLVPALAVLGPVTPVPIR